MAGYIGPAPVPQATQNREAFTATGGQTTFATSGYKPGYLDVYLNGVKLAAADYTATNGSDVVLASGAAASDILEIVAFQEFTVADQTFTGDITFTGASYDAVWDASDNALEFGDNAKATFGAGSDLQIYHDGSNSYIEEQGTGDLYVRGSDYVLFQTRNAADTAWEAGIVMQQDAGVTLYHDANPKLATTSTGIDVTGTVTADGLTVDGNTNGDPSLAHLYNISTGTAAEATAYITNSATKADGLFLQQLGSSFTTVGGFVQDGSTIGSGTGASGGLSIMTRAAADMRFYTNGHTNERMRIDSSGNLLVGTTSNAPTTTAGINLGANNKLHATRSSGTSGYFNRLTTDGGIVEFAKDGTTVGSIGVSASDDFYIGASTANHAGVYFGTDIVYPMRANSLSDGVTSIGHSSNRFNNLYLSGGVYLGGTGAANKLEDYEEGTWTPTSLVNGFTVSLGYFNAARYVKIGKIVHVTFDMVFGSATYASGYSHVGGLPFGAATTAVNGFYSSGSISGNAAGGPIYIGSGTTSVYLFQGINSNATTTWNAGFTYETS